MDTLSQVLRIALMIRVDADCSFSKGFFRGSCGAEAGGQCVYCGAPFCNSHGVHGDDYLEVCNRAKCCAKLDDVESHRDWIERVRGTNSVSVCAIEGCQTRMQHECGRCRLRFCSDHLKAMQILDRLQIPPRKVSLVLCSHCAGRRKLWDG